MGELPRATPIPEQTAKSLDANAISHVNYQVVENNGIPAPSGLDRVQREMVASYFQEWQHNYTELQHNKLAHIQQLAQRINIWNAARTSTNVELATQMLRTIIQQLRTDIYYPDRQQVVQAEIGLCIDLAGVWFKNKEDVQRIKQDLAAKTDLIRYVVNEVGLTVDADTFAQLLVLVADLDYNDPADKLVLKERVAMFTQAGRLRSHEAPGKTQTEFTTANGWEASKQAALPEENKDELSWFPQRRQLLHVVAIDQLTYAPLLTKIEKEQTTAALLVGLESIFDQVFTAYHQGKKQNQQINLVQLQQFAVPRIEALEKKLPHHQKLVLSIYNLGSIISHMVINAWDAFASEHQERQSRKATIAVAETTARSVNEAEQKVLEAGGAPKVIKFGQEILERQALSEVEYRKATTELVAVTQRIIADSPKIQQELAQAAGDLVVAPDNYTLPIRQIRIDDNSRDTCILANVQILMAFTGVLDLAKLAGGSTQPVDLVHHKSSMMQAAVEQRPVTQSGQSLQRVGNDEGVSYTVGLARPAPATIDLGKTAEVNHWLLQLAAAAEHDDLKSDSTDGTIRYVQAGAESVMYDNLPAQLRALLSDKSPVFARNTIAYMIYSFLSKRNEIFSVTNKDPKVDYATARRQFNHQLVINSMQIKQTRSGPELSFHIFDTMASRTRWMTLDEVTRGIFPGVFIAERWRAEGQQDHVLLDMQAKTDALQLGFLEDDLKLAGDCINASEGEYLDGQPLSLEYVMSTITFLCTSYRNTSEALHQQLPEEMRAKIMLHLKKLYILQFLGSNHAEVKRLNGSAVGTELNKQMEQWKQTGDTSVQEQLRTTLGTFNTITIRNGAMKQCGSEYQVLPRQELLSQLYIHGQIESYFVRAFPLIIDAVADRPSS